MLAAVRRGVARVVRKRHPAPAQPRGPGSLLRLPDDALSVVLAFLPPGERGPARLAARRLRAVAVPHARLRVWPCARLALCATTAPAWLPAELDLVVETACRCGSACAHVRARADRALRAVARVLAGAPCRVSVVWLGGRPCPDALLEAARGALWAAGAYHFHAVRPGSGRWQDAERVLWVNVRAPGCALVHAAVVGPRGTSVVVRTVHDAAVVPECPRGVVLDAGAPSAAVLFGCGFAAEAARARLVGLVVNVPAQPEAAAPCAAPSLLPRVRTLVLRPPVYDAPCDACSAAHVVAACTGALALVAPLCVRVRAAARGVPGLAVDVRGHCRCVARCPEGADEELREWLGALRVVRLHLGEQCALSADGLRALAGAARSVRGGVCVDRRAYNRLPRSVIAAVRARHPDLAVCHPGADAPHRAPLPVPGVWLGA